MFQPGEEGHDGARHMLEEGPLDGDDPPTAAFAIHQNPLYLSVGRDRGEGWACQRIIGLCAARGSHHATFAGSSLPVTSPCGGISSL